MKERKQLQEKLDILRNRHASLTRGRMVPSSRAQAVQRQILQIEEDLKRLDRDAAERLALSKAPIDEVLEVIAIPLLADVINDVVAGVDNTLRKRGVQQTVFGIYTQQIRTAALAMVDTLALSEADMPRLLDVDDTLVDAIKKKLMSFIRQRLNIKK